jgi:hypothetical protein
LSLFQLDETFQDVGIRNLGKRSPARKEQKLTKNKSSKKSLGSIFSSKKKALPPKDYEFKELEVEANPPLPQRKESLDELLKDSEDSCTSDDEPQRAEPSLSIVRVPSIHGLRQNNKY